MSNKEDGKYRPHYLAIKDNKNDQIFWMIPVSSKIEKYREIYQKQREKYGYCSTIVIGKCDGKDAAYLIQNAFPITGDFFDHIHTSNNVPLSLHQNTEKLISKYLINNIKLYKRGICLFFADVDRIYNLMIEHLDK